MVRVASYIDQKQKVYFPSRSEGNGVNTTNKLHGMGAETLPKDIIKQQINSCLKMESFATWRAFFLLYGIYQYVWEVTSQDKRFLKATVADNQKDIGGKRDLNSNFFNTGCVFPLKSSVTSKFLVHLSFQHSICLVPLFLFPGKSIIMHFKRLISEGKAATFLKTYL